MRIGQTSVIYFLGKITSSVVGFVATIYFARLLGAEVLGFYAVAVALVDWLKLGGTMGVGSAVQKRMSEDSESERYFVAGFVMVVVFATIVVAFLLLFHDEVNAYVGADVAHLIAVLSIGYLLFSIIGSGLKGQRRVHIYGILKPVNEITQTVTQVFLVVPVLFGLGLFGLLLGKAVGVFALSLVAIALLGLRFRRPAARHFQSLFSFAKYSWLGSVQSRTFKQADIIIMGFLVPSALIGVYSVAWSIAMFLTVFGASVRATLFPEISNASSTDDKEAVTLIEDGVAYQGLILVPGFVGGAILAEPLLRIYSDEFTQGTAVLWILILAVLVKGYQSQFLTALNGVDRPDVSFRIYAVFIISNLFLNVVLIYLYGWVGAAVATALSACIGLSLSYVAVRRLTEFSTPVRPIAEQWFAALIMGVAVYSGYWLERTYAVIDWNLAVLLVLVFTGAGVYFAVLFAVSSEFRDTVLRNIPGSSELIQN